MVFPACGLTSAPCSDLLDEFLTNAEHGAASRRLCPLIARAAPSAGAMRFVKTRYQNCPAETDAEIRPLVFGFAIRRQGRPSQMPRVRGHFAKNRKVVQKQ